MAARVLEPVPIQLPEALASALCASHKTGVLHHAQMFGDGLARDAGSRGERTDGCGSLLTEAHHQLHTDRVSQGSEERRRAEQLSGCD